MNAKWIVAGLTVGGLVAYWYTKSKQQSMPALGSLPVMAHPEYFRRLAIARDRQYKQAVNQIKQLQAKNEDMWHELQQKVQQQFKQETGVYIGGSIFDDYKYPPPTNLPPLATSPNLNNVNQLINDAEDQQEEEAGNEAPNMGVGPGIRKLNY